MRWNERQRAVLGEFGIRLWSVPSAAPSLQAAQAGHGAETDTAPSGRALTPEVTSNAAPAPEARSTVAAMDWAELRAAVSACTACTLAAQRRNTVFGTGNAHAEWMIIGEAPGEQEDLRGEPFVGKSGQLLDSMLAALRMTRSVTSDVARQVYIANTVKCRPPANRNPAPAELERCEPFLVRQIELIRPKVILAMGRFAVQALLRSDAPIGRLRGSVHRYGDVPLVVTYHPAYLLRNPQDKARAWEDMCLAREVVARRAHGD
jgi:DNA polymerase